MWKYWGDYTTGLPCINSFTMKSGNKFIYCTVKQAYSEVPGSSNFDTLFSIQYLLKGVEMTRDFATSVDSL